MVAWNMGRPWADQTRAYARTARMPIAATLIGETLKAFRISTGPEEIGGRETWVPKTLVTHDVAKGVFTMPMWMVLERRLS